VAPLLRCQASHKMYAVAKLNKKHDILNLTTETITGAIHALHTLAINTSRYRCAFPIPTNHIYHTTYCDNIDEICDNHILSPSS
jgi:hypothetical protein